MPADDAALVAAVQSANLPTLMMVLVHLTGDARWLRGTIRPRRASPQQMDGGLEPSEARQVREQALPVLRAFRDGKLAPRRAAVGRAARGDDGVLARPVGRARVRADDARRHGACAARRAQRARSTTGRGRARLSRAGDRRGHERGAGSACAAARGVCLHAGREERRCRRHVVRKHLSRLPRRPAESLLFVFVRAQSRLARPLLAPGELLAYFRRVADQVRRARTRAFRDRSGGRALRRNRAARWAATLRDRNGQRARAARARGDQRRRAAEPTEHPGLARARIVRRTRRSTARAGATTSTCAASASAIVGTGASAMQIVPQLARRGRAARDLPALAAVGAAGAGLLPLGQRGRALAAAPRAVLRAVVSLSAVLHQRRRRARRAARRSRLARPTPFAQRAERSHPQHAHRVHPARARTASAICATRSCPTTRRSRSAC